MEFDELLTHVIALLQRQGRVSYRALKHRFKLDDDELEDLKVELIEALQALAGDRVTEQVERLAHHGLRGEMWDKALALATAGREVVLQALANRYLGLAYRAQGNYRRAIDCHRQAGASLTEAQRHERLGEVFLPAVVSRAQLAWCRAELDTAIKLYRVMQMTFWLPETEAALAHVEGQ